MKHLFLVLTVSVMMSAYAADKPPSDSETEADTCESDAQSYDHGALKFFHSMLCLGNRRFAGMAENVFYHLVVDMGMDVSTDTLAADGTATTLEAKTFKAKAITGTVQKVVAPDTFAGTYDYRATLSVDGTQFMDVRWSGKGKESKGYLAMIPSALKPGGGAFTGKGLLYIRWDRTVSTAQSIEVLGARFASTFLGSVSTGDRATFYKGTLDDSTKSVTVQMVSIEKARVGSSAGCYTMYGTGTLGGTVTVGKTKDSLNNAGQLTGSTDTSGGTSEWDAFTGTDSKTTTNGTGNISAPGFTFEKSCADVNGLGSSAFTGDTVSFSLTKTQVDTMFQ